MVRIGGYGTPRRRSIETFCLRLVSLAYRAGPGVDAAGEEADDEVRRHPDYGLGLGFSGSNESWDWRRNLDCASIPSPWGPGRIHRGFFYAVRGLLERGVPDGVRVLAGHSFGGAVAQLLAAHLFADGQPCQVVMTFGAPRCCDAEFATWFFLRQLSIRYRFQGDPISWLPPWMQHPGPEIVLPGWSHRFRFYEQALKETKEN